MKHARPVAREFCQASSNCPDTPTTEIWLGGTHFAKACDYHNRRWCAFYKSNGRKYDSMSDAWNAYRSEQA